MKKKLALFCALFLASTQSALASIPTQPYPIVPNTVANGTQVQADFSTLYSTFTNIDYTNIGSAGLLASNLKPTNGSQATFGGSQTYTFPSGITANGNTTINGNVAATGYSQANYFNSNYSTTQGLWYAGGSNTGRLDFNLTTANQWDFTSSLTVQGNITNTGNVVSGGNGGFTGYVQGSYISSNYSNNQGLFYGGGGNTSQLDFNIMTANSWTFTSPLVVIGPIQQKNGGSTYVMPYDANSTSASTNTHIEHNSTTTGTFSGGYACTATTNFLKTYTAQPDFSLALAGGISAPTTLYINSRSTSNFQACAYQAGANSGTVTIMWFALGE